MFGIKELSINFLTGQPFLTALFLVLFILFAVYLYRRTNPPLSTGIRILLTSLRVMALLALFLALFEPVVSYRREYERKPKLTVLLDKSNSMNIEEDGRSRAGRVDSLFSSDDFRRFADAFDFVVEPFAGGLINDADTVDPDRTGIGGALDELSNKEIAEPSEAWLLVTDGISNSGAAPAEAALHVRAPIYTLGVGTETGEKDVAVSSLDYNRVVFAGKPTTVTVHLEWQGMDEDRAMVEIRSGQKVLSSENITLPAGNMRREIPLKITPEKPGQQTFRVSVQGIKDELSDDNNSRSFSMTVRKSRLNVLLVADRLDWEYAFLKRFLSRSESIDPVEVVYRKGGGYLNGRMPDNQADLNRYDLIILYDIDTDKLKSRKNLFESFLKDKGGSMLVFLGENYMKRSFPRWLDDLLPFTSNRKDGELVYFKYNGHPVENYLFHPAVRIAENRQAIREAWQTLPHFEALVPLDSVTPGSEILVTAGLVVEGVDKPIIGMRSFGAGRVLSVAALPFWHWAFFGYGFGDDDAEYRQLLDGVVNWLSVGEESDPVKIVPDKTVYTRGERVGFSAFVYDLGFRPISGASGYIALVGENSTDSTIARLVEEGEGRYRAEFDILSPGRYKYTGKVEKDGKVMKESSGQIALESYSVEEYRQRPDFGALSAVSMLTGGEFYRLNQADSLFGMIAAAPVSVSLQKEIIVWNKLWLLGLFILSLAAEWMLRKRYQLI